MPDWQSHGSPGAWSLGCHQTTPWSVYTSPQGWQLASVVCLPFPTTPTPPSETPQCRWDPTWPHTSWSVVSLDMSLTNC